MINDYVWQVYLKSGGSKVVSLFEQNLGNEISVEFASEVKKFHEGYCPDEVLSCNFYEAMKELSDIPSAQRILDNDEYSIESAMTYLYEFLGDEDEATDKQLFDALSSNIEFYSTELSRELPGLFFPYYFRYNFNVLQEISSEFGMNLPTIPSKSDYKGRFFYYGELCHCFIEFAEENNMTAYEFCAFLYDFAPKYVGGINYICRELPEPTSAFLIGSSPCDAFLSSGGKTILWQCNPETKVGDMIVMYMTSPESAVKSVWRSVSKGFVDPLFYYYRCTYISMCTIGKKSVSLKALRADCVLSTLPIVRKNMQGVNGTELRPSDYNYLIKKMEIDVPKIVYLVSESKDTLHCEKDVEKQLIIPLILKLGYSSDEYEAQLYAKVGNNNTVLIPDFVLKPDKIKGHTTAYAIIEAKYSIQTEKKLEEVKIQTRSYARLLNAKYAMIASKESVFVSTEKDDFTKNIFAASWQELNNVDVFHELIMLIGNE